MEYRTLGRTGVQVSPLCLGAMMFGAWGNTDHDESRPDHPPRARRGDQLHRHRRRLLARRVGGDRRQGARRRPARQRRARDQGPRQHGRRPERVRQLAPLDHPRGRGAPASASTTDWIDLYQIHRPEPRHRHRRDARRAHRPRPPGQGPLHRLLDVPRRRRSSRPSGSPRDRGRERFVCEQPPYSMLIRGVEADVLPTCRRHGMGVIPWSPLAGGWLSGRLAQGPGRAATRRARDRLPTRYDLVDPGQPAKLEAADALAQLAEEAGMSLIHLALAFVINHPAVTSAIIGPRTMEQLESQLGAADVDARRRRARPHRRDRAARARTSTRRTPAGRTRSSSPRRGGAERPRAARASGPLMAGPGDRRGPPAPGRALFLG